MYLFCILGLQNVWGTWITIRETCVVTLSHFKYKRWSYDSVRSKMLSELISPWIRHPSIIFSIIDMLVGYIWGLLLIPILSQSKVNMKAWPSCVGLGVLTKYLPLNFTFTGIPDLEILYLSANLVFNCFETNKSSSKSIFALHF